MDKQSAAIYTGMDQNNKHPQEKPKITYRAILCMISHILPSRTSWHKWLAGGGESVALRPMLAIEVNGAHGTLEAFQRGVDTSSAYKVLSISFPPSPFYC